MGLRIVLILMPAIGMAQDIHPTIRRMHHVNNSIRRRFQLPAQRLSQQLTNAAQFQANYLAKTNQFSHYVNGSPGTRAGRYGYCGTVVENIARAYNSVEDAFFAWADSPPHWNAISEPNVDVGFGYSIATDGTVYWVAIYGTPRKWTNTKLAPAASPLPRASVRTTDYIKQSNIQFLLLNSL